MDNEQIKSILRGAVQTAYEHNLSDDEIRDCVNEYVLLLRVREWAKRASAQEIKT